MRPRTPFTLLIVVASFGSEAAAQPASNYLLRPVSFTDAEHTRDTGERRSGFAGFNNGFNTSGGVVGYSRRFNGGSADLGSSAWVFDGATTVKVGLIDASHTRNDGYKFSEVFVGSGPFLTEAGWTAGYSNRYSGASTAGQSAWVYNGTATVRVGLFDNEHTDTGNFQVSGIDYFNRAGRAAGTSDRAAGGVSTWAFNGSSTVRIGLTGGAEYFGAGGSHESYLAGGMNAAGHIAGGTFRYNMDGEDLGVAVWVYRGGATQRVGLTGPAHTRDDGYQLSGIHAVVGSNGRVAGVSTRFLPGNSEEMGRSAWVDSIGIGSIDIGLTGSGYTREDGFKDSGLSFVNAAGQVTGFSARFFEFSDRGYNAWVYAGSATVVVGLTGFEHTRADNYQYSLPELFNEAGHAAGHAKRYNGGAIQLGQSAWVGTHHVGLTDFEHTSSGGRQFSELKPVIGLSPGGKAAGHSRRYDGLADAGQSAWVYNGSTTVRVGLIGAEHGGGSGYHYSYIYNDIGFNAAGQAAGYTQRNGGSAGQSAWVYDGTATVRVGLFDVNNIGLYTGSGITQVSQITHFNDAGKAAGYSTRYFGGSANGQAAWVFTGSATLRAGLADVEHTRFDGYQHSEVDLAFPVTVSGKTVGYSKRYNGGLTDLGQSSWVFDGSTTHRIVLSLRADGYAYSQVRYFDDTGLALGYYRLYADSTYVGDRAFAFTLDAGPHDLGLFVDGGLSANGWSALRDALFASNGGYFGFGTMSSMPTGEIVYVATPVPEPTTALAVGLLALAGGAAVRRRWPAGRAR